MKIHREAINLLLDEVVGLEKVIVDEYEENYAVITKCYNNFLSIKECVRKVPAFSEQRCKSIELKLAKMLQKLHETGIYLV